MADAADRPIMHVRVPIDIRSASSPDDLLTLAKSRAQNPDVFTDHPPFFWRAVPSTTQLDSYYTRMTKATLQNFANDAAEGRAFQNSHNHAELPLGYSLTGVFVDGANPRVEADFYTIAGLQIGALSTDQFALQMQAGLVRDVSVGFSGGKWICSICGRDMLADWDCFHFPGMTYSPNADGEKDRAAKDAAPVLCTADIDGASLSEVSAVFDGATPGAGILKAYRDIDLGRMPAALATRLEQTYRMKLPPIGRQMASAEIPATGAVRQKETDVGLEQDIRKALDLGADDDVLAAVTAAQGHRIKHDAAQEKIRTHKLAVAGLGAILGTEDGADPIAHARTELERMRPLADDGQAYRKACIDAAIAEGKRAMGDKFNEESYRGLLSMSGTKIDVINRFQADWQEMGDRNLAGNEFDKDGNIVPMKRIGGRLTQEEIDDAAARKSTAGKRVSMKHLS